VVSFWKRIGSRVEILSPERHDALVARTSHLPHLVAAALAGTVCRAPEAIAALCGAGFKDTTRIASGSSEVWHDIVRTNRPAIRRELEAFAESIENLRSLVDDEDYEGVRLFLDQCRARRQNVFPPT
jgi:prephenate dehydrogenase